MSDSIAMNNYGSVDLFRTGRAYTVAEAAKLAKTSPATVRRWLVGYDRPGHQMVPVFGAISSSRVKEGMVVSFLQLIEIVVVAEFRRGSSQRGSIKLDRLRRAHAVARKQWQTLYPFASLKLSEFGGHLLHEFDLQDPDGTAIALDLGGQWVLPGTVTHALETIDFSDRDGLALRWFPSGRDVRIVVDPAVGAGRPTVFRSGVSVDVIKRRFRAGESTEFIARDFDLTQADVEEALRYAVNAA